MTEQVVLFHCDSDHQWREVWPSPMVASVMAKRMGAIECPVCASDKIFLGWGPQPIQNPEQSSIQDRANNWLTSGDTGASSNAICAHMIGASKPRLGWSTPSDPDDLGRCLRLLEAIPEWKPRISEMAMHSKEWTALVAHWDEIAKSMADEVGIDWSKGRKAPITYDLMQKIRESTRQ